MLAKGVYAMARLLLGLVAALFAQGQSMMAQPTFDRVPEELAQRAEREGIVRVIVEVQPSDAETLEDAGATARGLCANLDCARLRIQSVLDEQHMPVVEELTESQMVMEVTAEGLALLENSPFVRRVMADALVPVPLDPEALPAPEGDGSRPEEEQSDERPLEERGAEGEADENVSTEPGIRRPPGLDAPH
jgi:hypothetical protein